MSNEHYWEVVLGPFDDYPEALDAANPIHAEHEQDFGIRIEEHAPCEECGIIQIVQTII